MLYDIQISLNKDKHTFKCLIYNVIAVCRGASKKQLRWNTLIVLQTESTQDASKVHKKRNLNRKKHKEGKLQALATN